MEKPNFEEVVLTEADLPALLDFIKEEKYEIAAFDVETNSAIEKEAELWGISFCFTVDQAFYLPIRSNTGEWLVSSPEAVKKFVSSLAAGRKLIMHNGIYDVLVCERNLGIDLTEFLYHDTILSKHLFDEERPHGLKETAVKYLGPWADKAQKELYDSIHKNGGKTSKENMEMYKADTEVLAKYACWDVILTMMLYNIFEERLNNDSVSHKLYYTDEIMPLYREVVIPMKRHGFPIDVKHFKKLQQDITFEIRKLEEEIQTQIYSLVVDFEKQVLLDKLKITFRSELGKELMRKYGYKKESLPDQPTCISKHYEDCYNFYCSKEEVKWVFNLNSNAHLGWLFFEKLGLEPHETTESGAPKVDADTIENISTEHKFAKKIVDFKKLQKLKGTYIDGVLERQIDETVYCSMLMFGTTSGRFSSTSPNLQNLPSVKSEDSNLSELVKKYTNEIRKGFVSRKGFYLVDADHESLEPKCFADRSGEKNLQDIFKTGADFYSSIARDVFKITDASVYKKDKNFLGTKYPEKRKVTKVFSLAVPYGAGAGRIASAIGVEYDEAQSYIDMYLNAYPNLKNYMETCDREALTKGEVKTIFGRTRHLKLANEMYKKYGYKILNKAWCRQKGLQEIYWEVKNQLNNSKNFKIQGLAAHVVNRGMLNLARAIKKEKLNATIILQIHDQVVVHAHESCVGRVKELMKFHLENAVIVSVPFVADPKIATNLKDSH